MCSSLWLWAMRVPFLLTCLFYVIFFYYCYYHFCLFETQWSRCLNNEYKFMTLLSYVLFSTTLQKPWSMNHTPCQIKAHNLPIQWSKSAFLGIFNIITPLCFMMCHNNHQEPFCVCVCFFNEICMQAKTD